MKKVLFTSHLANFSKFNKPFMRWFQEQGWSVHYASLDEESISFCDQHFQVDFNRSPFSLDNFKAYGQLKKIIDREKYDIIHCHTPMGGVVTRLAAREARKQGTKVIYTAHGFHFYKGAPLVNWLLYFPIEKFLSRFTDQLIVINEEDYRAALQHHFHAPRIDKLAGVGVDLERFHPMTAEEKMAVRIELGLGQNDFVLIYVAEFIPRKNHELLIAILPELLQKIPNLRVVFAGKGEGLEKCKKMVQQMELYKYVLFLGYRTDVEKLYAMSDILVTPSKQEGLPINVIEGMACGLPIVCSKIRGQVDVITDGESGILFELTRPRELQEKIDWLSRHVEDRFAMAHCNLEKVSKYSVTHAVSEMAKIYQLSFKK